eukprot:UN24179
MKHQIEEQSSMKPMEPVETVLCFGNVLLYDLDSLLKFCPWCAPCASFFLHI